MGFPAEENTHANESPPKPVMRFSCGMERKITGHQREGEDADLTGTEGLHTHNGNHADRRTDIQTDRRRRKGGLTRRRVKGRGGKIEITQ